MEKTEKPRIRKTPIFLAALLMLTIWWVIGMPRSVDEVIFKRSLSRVESHAVRLDVLYPRPWELVCGMHGYGGDLHLEKYGKTYPPAGDMQESVWAIRFIRSDGSSVPMSGTCKQVGVYLDLDSCLPRARATLWPAVRRSEACRNFSEHEPTTNAP